MKQLLPEEDLGSYRLVRLIAEGGMGSIWEAEQTTLGRRVAIKVVRPSMASDPEFRERFRNEARLAASLDHPNILTVFDSNEAEGHLFLSMALVNGLSLREMIDRDGFIGPSKAVSLLKDVGSGLSAAHKRGLVHRDVKPSNVLLDPDLGRTLITDFGVAKALGSTRATSSGQLLGTLAYMAPEQIEGREVDVTADVYSLGAMLFEMLTGSIPFPRETSAATMWAHINAERPKASEGTDVPEGFDPVIARAMAVSAGDRYPSVMDFVSDALAVVGQGGADEVSEASYADRIMARIDLSDLEFVEDEWSGAQASERKDHP